MARPDWDTWAFGIVNAVATRGDCTRRQVGALIVDTNHRIAGAGYNGGRPGGPSCLVGDCSRGRHYKAGKQQRPTAGGEFYTMADYCACDNWWPCPDAVPPGSNYDNCLASHAEINAVMDVDNRARLDGAVLYVSTEPCEYCIKHIRNTTQIAAIRWPDGVIGLP